MIHEVLMKTIGKVLKARDIEMRLAVAGGASPSKRCPGMLKSNTTVTTGGSAISFTSSSVA